MAATKRMIRAVDSTGAVKNRLIERKEKQPIIMAQELSYSSLGYYIIVPIIAGLFGGLWLDGVLSTKPVFILTFLVIGTTAAFYNLYKIIKHA